MKITYLRRWTCAAALAFLPLAPSSAHADKTPPPATSVADQTNVEATRDQLLTLLRVSPMLTSVVGADPSLLANNEYVAKTNPELAKFLSEHPEVGRNPDFYLFADIHTRGPNRGQALEHRVWTGGPEPSRGDDANHIIDQLIPMLITFAIIAAIAWLIKLLMANRRWNRVFRMQTEVHGKLIDRFGTNEEVLTYMQTDAGKRFLEAAPIAVDVQQEGRWPAVFQRVLMPLTAGLVLTLLGLGLLFMRHSVIGGRVPLLLFGVVTLMPGLGCIIAAGITWLLAQRLGLMPGSTRNGQ